MTGTVSQRLTWERRLAIPMLSSLEFRRTPAGYNAVVSTQAKQMQPSESHPEVRVLLIDTTKMACQLLAQAIGGDEQIKVVGAVTTNSEALTVMDELSP